MRTTAVLELAKRIMKDYPESIDQFELFREDPEVTLCAAVIARDEEDNIGRCVEGALECGARVVVLDTGSTDNTMNVAEEAGAEVYQTTWKNDFSIARNECLEYVRETWVWWIDADEYCNPEQRDTLWAALSDPDAQSIHVRYIHRDSDVKDTDLERLWRHDPACIFTQSFHEHNHWCIMALARRMGRVEKHHPEIIIDHWGYTQEASKRKNARNIPMLERVWREHPRDPKLTENLVREYYIAGRYLDAGRVWGEWYQLAGGVEGADDNDRAVLIDFAHYLHHQKEVRAAVQLLDEIRERWGPDEHLDRLRDAWGFQAGKEPVHEEVVGAATAEAAR